MKATKIVRKAVAAPGAHKRKEWRDNMPESLQDSPTYEKLDETVNDGETNFDEFESACDSLESAISDIQEMDLPRGFGRD